MKHQALVQQLTHLITKYQDREEEITELCSIVDNIEEMLTLRIIQKRQKRQEKQIHEDYVKKFCDTYLANQPEYWYHQFTNTYYYYSHQSSRLINISEDRLQPLLSEMLEDEHQPYRDDILSKIKQQIRNYQLVPQNQEYFSFIPTPSMILKVKNLFVDTFEDSAQVDYFLWFIGWSISRSINLDTLSTDSNSPTSSNTHSYKISPNDISSLEISNTPINSQIMIWIGAQIDVWIEWLKQAIHYHFHSFSTQLSEVKQSYHTSYPLPLVRVLYFGTNGYTLRSKYSSENDSLLLLLVGYHYYHRLYPQKQINIDIERQPRSYFLSQFQNTREFFNYFIQKYIKPEQSSSPSGCYIHEIMEVLVAYLTRSRLPKNVLTKKEVIYQMEQRYPSYRQTKQWYQGLVLHSVIKSDFVKDFIQQKVELDINNGGSRVIPITIDQLLKGYHEWRGPQKNRLIRYSDMPKKEFVRYLQHISPDNLIRDDTAFNGSLPNFSITAIISQFYDHHQSSSTFANFQNFQSWYGEIYPHYEPILQWQFKMYIPSQGQSG